MRKCRGASEGTCVCKIILIIRVLRTWMIRMRAVCMDDSAVQSQFDKQLYQVLGNSRFHFRRKVPGRAGVIIPRT